MSLFCFEIPCCQAQNLQAWNTTLKPVECASDLLKMQCNTCFLQVVVLDKLDYCATLNNLEFTKNNKNFKVNCD